jgi:putative cardiolipin synthase
MLPEIGDLPMRAIAKAPSALCLLLAVLAAAGCSSLPPRPELPEQTALAPAATSKLDQAAIALADAHPGQSGFHLVASGTEAFALRALAARAAGRSLDLQYYIWHDDLTGKLLAREVVAAADRGVRVRLLLDDMDARAKNFVLAGLDAHPNIEVRLFNPFGSREGKASGATEMAFGLKRLNHRMHNKSWIADGRLAIAGGRNVGDEYFAAGEGANFVDLDLASVGPAVAALSDSFDRYWNSAAVWPIAALSPELTNQQSLDALRAKADGVAAEAAASPWVQALAGSDAVQRLQSGQVELHWTATWQVTSDDPLKALGADDPLVRSAVMREFATRINAAQSSIVLISPYFVPGDEGSALLIGAAKRGPAVKILTNSLAANDVAAVHGGYSKYRDRLLDGGVLLWELKPDPTQQSKGSATGSKGASLHSKSAIFDAATAFVGSFNLDPRSVRLNCEQGVFVTDPQIAAELASMFAKVTAGTAAWRVDHDEKGELRWSDGTQTLSKEPEAGFSRKFQSKLFRWLPFDSQL